MNTTKMAISYLQIPMSITSCYFAFANDTDFYIFGLTLSFATLESKPNNRIDKYIINKPKLQFSIVFISLIGLFSIFFVVCFYF